MENKEAQIKMNVQEIFVIIEKSDGTFVFTFCVCTPYIYLLLISSQTS